MLALFLLLVIAAIVLGIVGVVAKGLLYLLIIGIVVFLGALLLGALADAAATREAPSPVIPLRSPSMQASGGSQMPPVTPARCGPPIVTGAATAGAYADVVVSYPSLSHVRAPTSGQLVTAGRMSSQGTKLGWPAPGRCAGQSRVTSARRSVPGGE